MNAIKNVWGLIFAKLPGKYQESFALDCANKNNWRFAILPFFNILTQIACYAIYLYIYPATYPDLPRLDQTSFTAFSIIYIIINLIMSICFFRLRTRLGEQDYVKKSNIMLLIFLSSYVLLEGIETTLEVEISGNIYRFLATYFIVAFLPVMGRRKKFFIMLAYMLIVEAGFAILIRNGYPTTNHYREIVAAFFIVCVFLSNILYSGTIRNFILHHDLVEANAKLQYLTVTDPLTQISNRRAFNEYIAKVWADGKRNRGAITVMMIDIDHFKKYNDTFGHQKGDECLVQVAACIKAAFKRSIDMVARYGGEEFIALTPYTEFDAAAAMAEALRKEIESTDMGDGPDTCGVTVSIGVASAVPGIDSTYESLIKCADDLLYEAKRNGRNQVRSRNCIE